jgi:hypothetical protein
MQISAGAECFVWEFLSSSMSVLVDLLDVAFAVSIYINIDGGNWSLKVISHQIQIN